ncbi:MAG: hypothetical protein D6689_08885 [Deltaproteobacteria bacterium]|nr:MAG: hypothetical protein D6689_08885 [Deltaproteobacteria bacterium]
MIGVWATACGGSQQPEREPPPPPPDAAPAAYDDVDDTLVDPMTIDEINLALERRAPQVSRCYARAIESGALPRTAKGVVVVELTIARDGSPQDVHVLPASTLKAPPLADCVVREIRDARFPSLPKPLPMTYSYKLERDY